MGAGCELIWLGWDRPDHRHEQRDRETNRYFNETMSRHHPGRTITGNQQHDAERDCGKTVCRADAEDRAENAADKDAGAVNHPA